MRNPLSVSALIDWLRTMPADEEYAYTATSRCLVCRFFDHIGLRYHGAGSAHWWDEYQRMHDMPGGFDAIARRRPHTFGAALERAERALAEASS